MRKIIGALVLFSAIACSNGGETNCDQVSQNLYTECASKTCGALPQAEQEACLGTVVPGCTFEVVAHDVKIDEHTTFTDCMVSAHAIRDGKLF